MACFAPMRSLVFAAASVLVLGCPSPHRHEDRADAAPAPSSSSSVTAAATSSVVPAGKYGCTASHFDARSGTYEYRPKGSIVLSADGTYTYLGFAQPSSGRWSAGTKTKKLSFAGGYLNGGEGTPIEGRTGQMLVVAPAIDGRWKCGIV